MAADPSSDVPVATRPRRQEQEPATDEVIEVAPGILRAQLPIDMPGLGHVNCYVLTDERGAAVVDPGLPGPQTAKALTARLASIGIPIKRVHTVVVTHSHPDHFGGAGWIRRESGAEVVTHKLFHTFFDRHEPPDLDIEDATALATDEPSAGRRKPWEPAPWGGPGLDISRPYRWKLRAARHFPRFAKTPEPTVRLVDDSPLRLAGREWFAVYTPGHTDDHLCFFDPTERVLLSGDHVLPTITPHIGGLVRNADPLASFFASLDKVAKLGDRVDIVLPAHGNPFPDLAGRAENIQAHHLDRLDVARRAFDETGRPMSVQELSTSLFSPRAQGPMADSETFAHLEHLRRLGQLSRDDTDAGYRYQPT